MAPQKQWYKILRYSLCNTFATFPLQLTWFQGQIEILILYLTDWFRQIPVPPKLFDEMEQLYAPPDHAVFTLVPHTFHECATKLYFSIGEPEVTVKTFWDNYCNTLGRLWEPTDDQLKEALNTFQANPNNNADGMALLQDIGHVGGEFGSFSSQLQQAWCRICSIFISWR